MEDFATESDLETDAARRFLNGRPNSLLSNPSSFFVPLQSFCFLGSEEARITLPAGHYGQALS